MLLILGSFNNGFIFFELPFLPARECKERRNVQPPFFPVCRLRVAAVSIDGPLRNREAETRPAGVARAAFVHAIEPVKNLGVMLRWNARAVIADFDDASPRRCRSHGCR